MNNRTFGFLLLLFLTSALHAQNVNDALRYSVFDLGLSTGRALGSGGAMGALGADFSVLSTNPAGLGWYRKSEFIFTPAVSPTLTQSRLNDDENARVFEDSRGGFNIASLGTIVAGQPRNSNWTTFNFGIGVNRIADFNQKFFFDGRTRGSITDRFLELANSDGLDDFEAGVAFDAFAIYDANNDGFYNSDFELAPNALVRKDQLVTSRGSMNELAFSFAGNYNERVLIGMTIGVPFVNFSEEKVYRESDPDDNIPFFNRLEYTENVTTTGTGINFKAGIIVRPHQAVRLGMAVHSPTSFRLSDSYRSSMGYEYTEDGQRFSERANSPDGLFEYRLRTPWRFIGSAGLIIGKVGFISAELEQVNYSRNRFDFGSFVDTEREVNDNIKGALSAATHLRLGGELAYEVFRFRGGIGIHGSAFGVDDPTSTSFSLGLGLRERSFFMDLGYRRHSFREFYYPYLTSQAPQPSVTNEVARNQVLLTFGFKF